VSEPGGEGDRAFDPIKLRVPEHVFLEALVTFLWDYMIVPQDGKWREIQLCFDIKSELADQPKMGGFMLGGRNAG
jgi:hypothetical protein